MNTKNKLEKTGSLRTEASLFGRRPWWRSLPYEAIVWLAGLVFLASQPPGGSHFSICPFSALGFEHCPGCGLGKSVAYLFRGEWAASFAAHPLGIFAVIMLSFRILQLTKTYLHQLWQK
ncbi:MAG: DUF2752 domain-containing protein [Bacteroidia bacterium]|nr:DUF2752 domain-containing protein [Bacteroidia bacterium]